MSVQQGHLTARSELHEVNCGPTEEPVGSSKHIQTLNLSNTHAWTSTPYDLKLRMKTPAEYFVSILMLKVQIDGRRENLVCREATWKVSNEAWCPVINVRLRTGKSVDFVQVRWYRRPSPV